MKYGHSYPSLLTWLLRLGLNSKIKKTTPKPRSTATENSVRPTSVKGSGNRAALYFPYMAGVPQPNSAKTFYLETFGCQMNVHDSEKVIGTLVQEGYRQGEKGEEGDPGVLHNCLLR